MDLAKRMLDMENEMNERIDTLSVEERIHLADLVLILTRCYGTDPNSAVVLAYNKGKLSILSMNNTELEAHTLCKDAASILADSLGSNNHPKDIH
jgi:hypothetical protein